MSSGFLLADALSAALRRPYHRGDMEITLRYLSSGLKVGSYRVMLKRNFDTACWIPPVGKRASHSIYYGDRMLDRVIDRYCKTAKIEGIPSKEDLANAIIAERKKELADYIAKAWASAKGKAKAAALAASGTAPGKDPEVSTKISKTEYLDAKTAWLKENLDIGEWDDLVDMLARAVASYGRHEREHARNTTQDLKQVNRDLRTFGIPFQIFNLFEDARIEHISRQALGVPFEWMDLEEIAPADSPYALMLRCIQLEGQPDDEAQASLEVLAGGDRDVGELAEVVANYYSRAIVCPTTEHLYPILTEFVEEFKEYKTPPAPPGKGAGGKGKGGSGEGEEGEGEEGDAGEDDEDGSDAGDRAGDLSTAAEAADKGDEFLEEFETDSEVIGGTDAEGAEAEAKAKGKLSPKSTPKGPGSKSPGSAESVEPQESSGKAASTKHFLAETPGVLDETYAKRVTELTTMLMRMFRTHNLPAATEAPAQRMSSRHLARGEVRFLHRKIIGGKSKRNYSIVYDCSGSMGGRPDREGKLLLLALNNLAKRGFLKGTLVLSGWVNSKPGWLSYQFPVSDEVILRIAPTHNAEGLQSALADNLKHLKNMDDVFVYTDAMICDAPLDRGFFASHRIWPVGLYAGSEDVASEMGKHFPQNIIRDNIEQVVEAMLTRNRRTVS